MTHPDTLRADTYARELNEAEEELRALYAIYDSLVAQFFCLRAKVAAVQALCDTSEWLNAEADYWYGEWTAGRPVPETKADDGGPRLTPFAVQLVRAAIGSAALAADERVAALEKDVRYWKARAKAAVAEAERLESLRRLNSPGRRCWGFE